MVEAEEIPTRVKYSIYQPAKHSYQGSTEPFNEQLCAARVRTSDRFSHVYQCPNKGRLEEYGHKWCKRHAPSREDAKEAVKQAQREYESAWWRWKDEHRHATNTVADGVLRWMNSEPGSVVEQLALNDIRAYAEHLKDVIARKPQPPQ